MDGDTRESSEPAPGPPAPAEEAIPPPPPLPPSLPPPPAEPPPYSPPPTSAPTAVAPAFAQQFGAPYVPHQPPPPAVARQGGGRTLLAIGVVVMVMLAALGAGAVLANASLSSAYNPQRAVSDYFAAMGRGDVNGMMSNATFLTGDSTYSQFFDRNAVVAMMAAGENQQISAVKVGAASKVDDSTESVDVALSWGGSARSLTYRVRKDTARTHYLFYPSWRVQVPFTTITLNLPNQAGGVQIDGIDVAGTTAGTVEAIQGFHKVAMAGTDFYDANTQTADAVDATASVTFPTALSSSTQTAASDSVKGAFNHITCDASKYIDCPNHNYKPDAGYYETLEMPGGNINAYNSWNFAFEGDPTTGEKFTVATTAGEVDASGTCGVKLTTDGSHVYHFVGTWTGTLTWSNGGFSSQITFYCDQTRA